jgi:hypothetical protein
MIWFQFRNQWPPPNVNSEGIHTDTRQNFKTESGLKVQGKNSGAQAGGVTGTSTPMSPGVSWSGFTCSPSTPSLTGL